MRVFERIRDWWRAEPEISNDELVVAHEYVVWAHGCEFVLMAYAPWHADEVDGPREVIATLRKLGAR